MMDITSEHICKAIAFTWKASHKLDSDFDWHNVLLNLLGMWKLVRHTSCDYSVMDDIDFLMDIAAARRKMLISEAPEVFPMPKGFYNHD